MKRQRIYIDRPQTTQMKHHISQNYIKNIAPYELLIESINLQNKEIYSLQQKYLQLLQQTKSAKQQQSYTENQRQILQTREDLKIQQRKKFVQQGLKANSIKYHEQFQRKKKSLQQVLENKKQMLKFNKAKQLNVFFNLQQHILDQLIDFGQRGGISDVLLHNNKDETNQKQIQEIKWWKRRYNIEMKSNQALTQINKQ